MLKKPVASRMYTDVDSKRNSASVVFDENHPLLNK
jgi:hypothetical protein